MSIVIRLDVPALERLIGGDTEVEVQLRKGVVEEFARRHLTAVLKDEAFAGYLAKERSVVNEGLNALVKERIGEIKREPYGYNSRDVVYLSREAKDALTTEAEKRVGEFVRKTVEEVWARREPVISREVYKLIAEKTDRLTESVIQDAVKERLAKIAKTIKGD